MLRNKELTKNNKTYRVCIVIPNIQLKGVTILFVVKGYVAPTCVYIYHLCKTRLSGQQCETIWQKTEYKHRRSPSCSVWPGSKCLHPLVVRRWSPSLSPSLKCLFPVFLCSIWQWWRRWSSWECKMLKLAF